MHAAGSMEAIGVSDVLLSGGAEILRGFFAGDWVLRTLAARCGSRDSFQSVPEMLTRCDCLSIHGETGQSEYDGN
jgi:hypothetical protein